MEWRREGRGRVATQIASFDALSRAIVGCSASESLGGLFSSFRSLPPPPPPVLAFCIVLSCAHPFSCVARSSLLFRFLVWPSSHADASSALRDATLTVTALGAETVGRWEARVRLTRPGGSALSGGGGVSSSAVRPSASSAAASRDVHMVSDSRFPDSLWAVDRTAGLCLEGDRGLETLLDKLAPRHVRVTVALRGVRFLLGPVGGALARAVGAPGERQLGVVVAVWPEADDATDNDIRRLLDALRGPSGDAPGPEASDAAGAHAQAPAGAPAQIGRAHV